MYVCVYILYIGLIHQTVGSGQYNISMSFLILYSSLCPGSEVSYFYKFSWLHYFLQTMKVACFLQVTVFASVRLQTEWLVSQMEVTVGVVPVVLDARQSWQTNSQTLRLQQRWYQLGGSFVSCPVAKWQDSWGSSVSIVSDYRLDDLG
jgi:hypothetical protein